MGLNDLVAGLIADVLDPLTKDFQAEVTHIQWTGQDGFGKQTYEEPVLRHALVEPTRKMAYNAEGQLVRTLATVTFLETIPDHGAPLRHEPIDLRDKIVLSDGTTGPIVSIQGLTNPSTDRPYTYSVVLGQP